MKGPLFGGGLYFILAQTDRSIVVVVIWKLKIALLCILLQVPSSFLSNLPLLLLVAYINIIMVYLKAPINLMNLSVH